MVAKEVFEMLKGMERPKLADYSVGAVLGTGTFGTVFVAVHAVRAVLELGWWACGARARRPRRARVDADA